jgi:neutral ceramidase
MFQIGIGKADITAFVKGAGMLGYGLYFNTMEEIETPLFARAFVLIDAVKQTKVCIVNCELGFITLALKKGVIKELKRRNHESVYDDDNLMLTAQHTHSGPGGYSYYGLYNISIPGFVMEIYQKLVTGVADAIEEAEKNLQPGKIYFTAGEFGLDKKVAFNRSLNQYNQNPEVKEKITQETAHLGVNREMILLKFVNEKGEDLGCINWFGVHTTSISNDNHKINSDNKGYASKFMEDDFKTNGTSNFIAAFAQGTCGDITPRFKYNPKRPFQRGKWDGMYEDDFESAKYTGNLQFEKAKELYQEAEKKGFEIKSEIDYDVQYVNFTDVLCNPEFANGELEARTGYAAQGLAFFGGAVVDGPGAHPIVSFFAKIIIRIIKIFEKTIAPFKSEKYRLAIERKYRTQGKKDILMETHARRILGTKHIGRMLIPAWADPSIGSMKNFHRMIGHRDKPWTAKILPLQIFTLGDVALVAFPFEITTIAGKRLRASLEQRLKEGGIRQVILVPYANGYSGYMTTFEEYQVQMYEGGHTVFGEWSFAALQTKFDELAKAMLLPKSERQIKHDDLPPHFTEEELNLYPFYKRSWYKRKEARENRKKK